LLLIVTADLAMVAMNELLLEKVTDNPDVAVATKSNGASPKVFCGIVLNVIC
jgi:hypothetical protein